MGFHVVPLSHSANIRVIYNIRFNLVLNVLFRPNMIHKLIMSEAAIELYHSYPASINPDSDINIYNPGKYGLKMTKYGPKYQYLSLTISSDYPSVVFHHNK